MVLTVFPGIHFFSSSHSLATLLSRYFYFYIMKGCQSYSNEIKQTTVRVILESAEWKEICEGKRQRLSSRTLDLASVVSNGASHNTINRWINSDISLEAESERLSRRGRPIEITPDVRALCAGYAINRRLELKAVSRQDIIDFARGIFDISISPQRVSEIMSEYGLSYQLAMSRNSRMTSPEVAEAAYDFIMDLREMKLNPNDILVMDETGLWSNVTRKRTYHFINLYELSKYFKNPSNFLKFHNSILLTRFYFLSQFRIF